MLSPRARRVFMGQLGLLAGVLIARGALPPPALSIDQLTVAGCSLPNHDFEAALRAALELGFAGVEIAVFAEKEGPGPDRYPWARLDRLSEEERVRLQALVRRFQHVTTHLPYGPDLRPIARDPDVREKSRHELRRALDDSAFWGAELANIHVMSEDGVPFAEAKEDLVQLYRELGAQAARHGMRLAIETTRPYRLSEYLELIKAVGRENVGGTVDTGHLHFFRAELPVVGPDRSTPEGVRRYNDLLLETVAALGSRLFHLHLDDVRRADWREHFVPGTGIIDWPRLFRHLAQVQYHGMMVAEILYYEGAADEGRMLTRAFTQKTRDGAPAAGLKQLREFMGQRIGLR